MPLHIKGKSFLISTVPCAFLGDVGFYGLQDLLLGLNNTALMGIRILVEIQKGVLQSMESHIA